MLCHQITDRFELLNWILDQVGQRAVKLIVEQTIFDVLLVVDLVRYVTDDQHDTLTTFENDLVPSESNSLPVHTALVVFLLVLVVLS